LAGKVEVLCTGFRAPAALAERKEMIGIDNPTLHGCMGMNLAMQIPCSHRAPAHEKRRTKLGKSAGLVPQVLDTPINPKGGGQGHQALVEEVMEEVEAHVAEAEEAMPLRTPMMLRIPILQQRCVRSWLTSSHPQAKAQR